MENPLSIARLFEWLTTPGLIPWVGLVAAFAAALIVQSTGFSKTPLKSTVRALLVAAIFLIAAWMLNSIVQSGSGKANGGAQTNNSGGVEGGIGQPRGPQGGITNGSDSFTITEDVDLVISFIPSPANTSMAQDFCCNLVYKESGGQITVRVKAKDMTEFVNCLKQELDALNERFKSRQWTVLITRSPWPGENVLRKVERRVREHLPDADIKSQ